MARDETEHALDEGFRRLEEARVAARPEHRQLGAPEGRGDRPPVARRREDVLLADEDERGRAEERQEAERVVTETGVDLALVGGDGAEDAALAIPGLERHDLGGRRFEEA